MRAIMTGSTLDKELRQLEKHAERAVIPGANAVYLNQAGDLCLAAGEMGRAMDYFGRAINAHVKADRFAAAAALCKKVMRVQPEVVRARCTLAWLSIGDGFEGDACAFVDSYVDAAERAGHERLAVAQLRNMAQLAAGDELRVLLGERLLGLGDDRAANDILGVAYGVRNGKQRWSQSDQDQRWSAARRAALTGPRP